MIWDYSTGKYWLMITSNDVADMNWFLKEKMGITQDFRSCTLLANVFINKLITDHLRVYVNIPVYSHSVFVTHTTN